jgi:hypothetical protein
MTSLPEPAALLLDKAIEDSLRSLGAGVMPFGPHVMALDDTEDLRQRRLTHTRFAGDLDEALLLARDSVIPGLPLSAYAITWDGYLTVDGDRSDAILVEVGTPDTEAHLFGQGYAVGTGRFRRVRVEKLGALRMVGTTPSRLWRSG